MLEYLWFPYCAKLNLITWTFKGSRRRRKSAPKNMAEILWQTAANLRIIVAKLYVLGFNYFPNYTNFRCSRSSSISDCSNVVQSNRETKRETQGEKYVKKNGHEATTKTSRRTKPYYNYEMFSLLDSCMKLQHASWRLFEKKCYLFILFMI